MRVTEKGKGPVGKVSNVLPGMREERWGWREADSGPHKQETETETILREREVLKLILRWQ